MSIARRSLTASLLLVVALLVFVGTAGAAPKASLHAVPQAVVAAVAAGDSIPGSCTDNDRVAAIPGYYATEKTCLETAVSGGRIGVRTHSVTRCWRDGGVMVACQKINGDTVVAQLWAADVLVEVTDYPDPDCFDCKENSHYSEIWCEPGAFLGGGHGRVRNIRVIFPNGKLSSYHTHNSTPLAGYLTCNPS